MGKTNIRLNRDKIAAWWRSPENNEITVAEAPIASFVRRRVKTSKGSA